MLNFPVNILSGAGLRQGMYKSAGFGCGGVRGHGLRPALVGQGHVAIQGVSSRGP